MEAFSKETTQEITYENRTIVDEFGNKKNVKVKITKNTYLISKNVIKRSKWTSFGIKSQQDINIEQVKLEEPPKKEFVEKKLEIKEGSIFMACRWCKIADERGHMVKPYETHYSTTCPHTEYYETNKYVDRNEIYSYANAIKSSPSKSSYIPPNRRNDHTEETGTHVTINPFEYKRKPQYSLFVSMVPTYTTEDDIYHHFGKLANIKNVTMIKHKDGFFSGKCFVNYYSYEDALQASKLDGTYLNNAIIKVNFDKNK